MNISPTKRKQLTILLGIAAVLTLFSGDFLNQNSDGSFPAAEPHEEFRQELPAVGDGADTAAPILSETRDSGTSAAGSETDYEEGLVRFSLELVPTYAGEPCVQMNGNVPYFSLESLPSESFEYYSPLDKQGRCGVTVANIGKDLMPTEDRGQIGMVKPSGWHTVRYDDLIDDRYLYNRCHLIGYQLTAENDNLRNLITGTRYLNTRGMLPLENQVADYVRTTGNHVYYRSTPVFEGGDLVARGVLIEAYSVEDLGSGICFCMFAYNLQPEIDIDYATGESRRSAAAAPDREVITEGYIGNKNSKVFHVPTCANLPAEKNQVPIETWAEAIEMGFRPCGNCLKGANGP